MRELLVNLFAYRRMDSYRIHRFYKFIKHSHQIQLSNFKHYVLAIHQLYRTHATNVFFFFGSIIFIITHAHKFGKNLPHFLLSSIPIIILLIFFFQFRIKSFIENGALCSFHSKIYLAKTRFYLTKLKCQTVNFIDGIMLLSTLTF